MKKYFMFFAAAALLLAGCAQNEVVENRSEKNAIGFRTLNDKVTRAANDANSNYGVYAVWNGNPGAWFMNNVEVNGTSNSYSPTQYWPHSGEVSFYAYAPYNSTNINKVVTDASSVGVTYTVPGSADEDFTIATPVKNATQSNGNVALNFKHMLTKVSVSAVIDGQLSLAGYSLDLDKATVEIKVARNTGTTDIMNDPAVLGSTDNTEPISYSKSLTTTPSFLFMPQPSYDSVSKVSIKLKGMRIKHNGALYWGDATNGSDMKTYEFTDKALNTDNSFKAGTHYAITFTIKNGATGGDDKPVFGNAITFSSTVADWTSASVGVDQPNGQRP